MSTNSKTVILESRNDRDLSRNELDDLAGLIREQLAVMGSDLKIVATAHQARGVGNQWPDVLNLFVPSRDVITDIVWTMVLDRIKAMMIARFSRKHEQRRPRVIVIRDAETGEVGSVLQAKAQDGGFIELDVTVADVRRPPPVGPNTRE